MSPASGPGAALAVMAALLALLPVFPPEVLGLSAAGCAALIALWAALSLKARPLVAAVLLLAAAAWPLSVASQAPGGTPWAVALPLLGLGAGAIGRAAGGSAPRLAPVFVAVAALTGLHALWQVAFGLDAAAGAIDVLSGGDPALSLALARLREGRAFASFATPAALGGFLAIALPVTLAAVAAAGGRPRLLLALAAALQAAGLAATQSATAVGALIAAGALFAIGRSGQRRFFLPALLVLLALLLAILVLRRDRLLDPSEAQGSLRLRAGNAAAAVRMIEAHPMLGVGPGAFAEVYPSVLRPGGNEVRHAHDLPLELAAELGIPLGLLATAAFGFLFVGPLMRIGREASPWEQGAAVGLAAFAIQNLADFTAFFPSLLWTACLLRGTLGRGEVGDAPAWGQVLARVAVAAAAVVAAATGLSSDARRDAAELLAKADPGQSVRLARRAAALAPWEADAHLVHGAALFRAGALPASLAETERALDLAPVRPAAHAQRARIRAAQGDLPGAYADLLRAAALYPARTAYAREAEVLGHRLARAYPERE